jgi:hypothetical protein
MTREVSMQHILNTRLLTLALALSITACASRGPEPLSVDLDGDGAPESIRLVQENAQVSITVEGQSVTDGSQTLTFGVDPARQDAVCTLPVTLTPAASDCAPEALGAQTLPGCVVKPTARGLTLSDGQCDAIHLYWNHDTRGLAWWRM